MPLFVRWFNNTDVLRNLSMHAPMSHAGDRRAAARAHQPHRLRGDERAQRSYRKAGFVHEETLRRSHFARVEHHDAHSMSLLREEWTALSHRRSWEYD